MSRAHFVKDEAKQKEHARQEAAERRRQEIQAYVAEQLANAVYLEDHTISPANSERQMGQPLFATEFEKRLKKLNPYFYSETNPFDASKKALYVIRGGKKEFVCAYENGIMPEHSVMKVREEEIWDPTSAPARPGSRAIGHFDRRDFPKAEWNADKQEFEYAGSRPGWKKVKLPWGEAKRGWRTVLMKCVISGLLTKWDVESTFGSANRAEWAGHLGSRPITTPW